MSGSSVDSFRIDSTVSRAAIPNNTMNNFSMAEFSRTHELPQQQMYMTSGGKGGFVDNRKKTLRRRAAGTGSTYNGGSIAGLNGRVSSGITGVNISNMR